MAIKDWLINFFGDKDTISLTTYEGKVIPEIFFKELAIQTCVNLIANAVSRSEFLTYEKGKEVRKNNYYLFNVEPNTNYNASKFWREVVHKLVYENEALIIMQNDMLYVAESFSVDRYAFKENMYKNIVVQGLTLRETLVESQVLHLEYHNQKIKTLLEGLYSLYGELLAYSKKNYKRSNAKRGTLDVPTSFAQNEKQQKELSELLNKRFKTFFEAEGGAVLPLTNGLKYNDLNSNSYKTGSDSRDVRALIDDIFDFVAIAFQIPPQLLKGTVADTSKAMDDLITICVNPIVEIIADEVNRKYYGKKLFLERTYLKIDTSLIKAVNLKDIAGSLEILLRIGANSVNDNLKILGREPINEPWADEHFITKNYGSVKGGERIEDTQNNN